MTDSTRFDQQAQCSFTVGRGNALPTADMRKQVQVWDRAIDARMKEQDCGKKQAMRRLRIKSSTYYKYRKLTAQKTK